MATLEYRNHTIISYVRPSKDHKQFLPGAIVRWKASYGRLMTYFLRPDKPCRTTRHAHATALREAKAWIRWKLSPAGIYQDQAISSARPTTDRRG
jgi:hypothetical protein